LFFPVVVFLLLATAVAQFFSVISETQTWDEANQLIGGYGFLMTGRYTHGLEHPPLAKVLFALSLLGLDEPLPARYDPRHDLGGYELGSDLLYYGATPADTLLLRARLVAILLRSMLGLVTAFWARRWLSPGAAVAATWFFALDPNFLAHGRYIKNDVPLVLFFFAAVAVWGAFLVGGKRRDLWGAGILAGLAAATKFSALLLGPIFLALWLLRRWQRGRETAEAVPRVSPALSWATAGGAALVVIWACYAFEIGHLTDFYMVAGHIPSGPAGEFLRRVLQMVPVPAPSMLLGLKEVTRKSNEGLFTAYALGRHAVNLWYLSFVALLVKTPVATLAIFLCALAAAAGRIHRWRWQALLEQARAADFKWFVLSVPPAIYLAAAIGSKGLNAGIRHLLPLYPFLYIFSAGVLWDGAARIRRWGRPALAAAGLLLLVESVSIYPHYLAFFNALSGGPAHGPEYLVDSNLDWGQDLKHLKTWLEARNVSDACVVYHGMADPDYYRVPHGPIPAPGTELHPNCVLAISATLLYFPGSAYHALIAKQPMDRIGYSIYVYDLRERPF
jgi:hypothetical protein